TLFFLFALIRAQPAPWMPFLVVFSCSHFLPSPSFQLLFTYSILYFLNTSSFDCTHRVCCHICLSTISPITCVQSLFARCQSNVFSAFFFCVLSHARI